MQGKNFQARLPLEGVRVVVLGQAIAGPMTGRLLANYGAEVIRVEWSGHLDRLRHALPSKRSKRDVNSSARWPQYNAGVKSIGLDLRLAAARQAFLDLVHEADVLIFNFAAHVMPSLGLDPDAMLRANPKLVIALLTLFGEGRYREQPGLGDGLSAYTGFYWLTGWPDASPLLPQGPYTDYIAPALTATSIIAALEEIDAGGDGRILDISELEFGSWFLMPEVIASQLSSGSPIRNGFYGNGPGLSVVVPAKGEDRWCTITVERDEQWVALCNVLGRQELAFDPQYRGNSERFVNRDLLVAVISCWSASRDREEIQAALRDAGILAIPVADARDVQDDPMLAARDHWIELDRCDNGRPVVIDQFPMRFTQFSAQTNPAPDFSEHAHQVLKEVLRYSDERIADLVRSGAVE